MLGKEILKNNDLDTVWKLLQAKLFCYCDRRKREKMKRRRELFDVGQEIVQENLDSLSIIKSLEKLKMISRVFFSEEMNYLLPYMMLKFKKEEIRQE